MLSRSVAVRGTSRAIPLLINKPWFDDRLRAKKISQRKLATMMDMDASAMSLMLNGKRKMSAAEAGEVAKLLGVPVEEVMRHAGIDVPVNADKSVPVVGFVGNRMEIHFKRPKGPLTSIAPADCPDGCQALRVQAEGLMEGWLVFYLPNTGVSLEAVGRLCVVKTVGDDQLYLRLVNRGYEAGYHILTSLRGGEPLHVRLESAAPVLWLRQ